MSLVFDFKFWDGDMECNLLKVILGVLEVLLVLNGYIGKKIFYLVLVCQLYFQFLFDMLGLFFLLIFIDV